MPDFTDQIALVTGATGALGSVVARRFRAAGARLVLPVRDLARWHPETSGLAGGAGEVLVHACDLTDPEAVAGLVAAAEARFGRIDVVANVAGGFSGGQPVAETGPEVWEAMWGTNLRPAVNVCRAVVPGMLSRGRGAIVNVGSRAGLHGDAGVAAYSASKAAVLRLTESLAAEVKAHGVRVNCVLPATIDTAANHAAMPAADSSTWVAPEAIADVILFLASPAARAIHGAAIPVYGPR